MTCPREARVVLAAAARPILRRVAGGLPSIAILLAAMICPPVHAQDASPTAAASAGGTAASAVASPLRIERVRLGYDGRLRPGRLAPIFVYCINDADTAVDARLRLVQDDQDGDLAEWTSTAPLAAHSARWHALLMRPDNLGYSLGQMRLSLEVARGDDYEAAAHLDLNEIVHSGLGGRLMPLEPGTLAVGVIGESVGPLADITAARINAGRITLGQGKVREMAVFSISPDLLPPDWRMLEFVDVIVWEDPDIAAMTADRQTALAQWVLRGGRLVVALGPRAGELASAAGDLRHILPVSIGKLAVPVDELEPLYAAAGYPGRGKIPATICRMSRRRGCTVASTSEGLPLLCRAAAGAGEVAVLAGRLEDLGLTRQDIPRGAILRSLLGWPLVATSHPVRPLTLDFAGELTQRAASAALVGVAMLLCLAYVLIAGPGCWLLLKRRGAVKYSWWVFGVTAAAASVLFTFLAMLRLTDAQASIAAVVDMEAGVPFAAVRGYCGVYLPEHGAAEVRLDRDVHASLSPMILEQHGVTEGYTDVRHYAIDLASPNAFQPFFRRTVKRFACNWTGGVDGALDAAVELGRDEEFTTSPKFENIENRQRRWRLHGRAVNDFEVDLKNLVLLCLLPDDAGLAVYRLGDLEAGQTLEFDSALDEETGGVQPIRWVEPGGELLGWVEALPMFGYHGETLGRNSVHDLARAGGALSLLSRNYDRIYAFDAADLRGLDRSSLLACDRCLLVAEMDRGFNPLPVLVDGRPVDGEGRVSLRVLAPLKRSGPAPRVFPRVFNAPKKAPGDGMEHMF